MSFRVEQAAGHRRQLRRQVTQSRGVATVENAVKCGRSPAKRTLEGVRNAHTLRGLGLVAAFRGQRASPSGGKDFTALGGGARGGAPAGLGRGIRVTGVGSTPNDLNPFKTAHHERFRYDVDAPAVGVALATSAAPTYFAAAPFLAHADASYVDGGVWANSPVMVAVTEAVAFLGIALDDIEVLSVGTMTSPFSIAAHADSGIAQWNAGLVELMFERQMEADLAQAKLLLNGRLHRVDVTARAGEFSLDDAHPKKIQCLINFGRGEAVKKENLDVATARFLNDVAAAAFQRFHQPVS